MKYAPPSQDEQYRHKELAVQLQQRRKNRRGPRKRDIIAGVVRQQAAEKPGVCLLPHESLRDAYAADRLCEGCRDPAEAVLGCAGQAAELHPEVIVDQPEDRRHRRDHEKQLPVPPGHGGGGKDHLPKLDRAHKSDVLDSDSQCLDVARHPADDAAELHSMEEGHGLPLHLREYLGPNPAHHRLPYLEGVTLAEMEHSIRQYGQRRVTRRSQGDHGHIAARDRSGDHHRHDPHEPRKLGRPDDRQGDQQPNLALYRPRVAEQAANQPPLERLELLPFVIDVPRPPDERQIEIGGVGAFHAAGGTWS